MRPTNAYSEAWREAGVENPGRVRKGQHQIREMRALRRGGS